MLVSKFCWFLFTLPRAYQVAAYTSLSSASSKPFATVSAHRRPHVAVARRYCWSVAISSAILARPRRMAVQYCT
jgi:hypothetical protein